jgi:hypothetical protein
VTVRFHARGTLGLGPPVQQHLRPRTNAQRTTQHMGLTWHHTGADGNLFHPDPIERLRGIYRYHVKSLGYGDIAYNAAFDADANTFGLRDGQWVSAHAQSTGNIANVLTDGVVFLEDERGITPGALEAFEWWVNVYRVTLHRVPQMFAHRWWGEGHGGKPTACPGDDWDRVVRFVGGHW